MSRFVRGHDPTFFVSRVILCKLIVRVRRVQKGKTITAFSGEYDNFNVRYLNFVFRPDR